MNKQQSRPQKHTGAALGLARALRRCTGRAVPPSLKRRAQKLTLHSCHRHCVYCGSSLGRGTLTLDHVLPLALGGTNDPSNIAAACQACNQAKGDTHPDDWFDANPEAAVNFLRYATGVAPTLRKSAIESLRGPYRDGPIIRISSRITDGRPSGPATVMILPTSDNSQPRIFRSSESMMDSSRSRYHRGSRRRRATRH